MERCNKTLQELTIADDFMFGAVMQDPENCRLLLERILDMSIAHVDVIREKSIIYHPEYKGVRLDVVAKDENNTRFDVEMQVRKTPIGKRSRYYHSQMDMEILLAGTDYDKLPDSYVIYICDYDPFGQGRYRYTFNTKCNKSKSPRRFRASCAAALAAFHCATLRLNLRRGFVSHIRENRILRIPLITVTGYLRLRLKILRLILMTEYILLS